MESTGGEGLLTVDSPELEELLSNLYHSLRTARRRHVIRCLNNAHGGVLTTRQLARKIASTECDIPERRATGEPYRNVYNALSQTHLPTLSEARVIIYDPQRQIVTPGAYFDLAVLLLDTNTPTVSVFWEFVGQYEDSGQRD